MVSNKGRVKSLARTVSHLVEGKYMFTYSTEEKILKQAVIKRFNQAMQTCHYNMSFRTMIDTIAKTCQISRAVYFAWKALLVPGIHLEICRLI